MPRVFEVHIQTWLCSPRPCNCAVAVREGNVILIMNACPKSGRKPLWNVKITAKVLTGNVLPQGARISIDDDSTNIYTVGPLMFYLLFI